MSAGWPRAAERSQQLGEVQQPSSVASLAVLLYLSHGVTEPREVLTMWCGGSRTESRYPCCPHHLPTKNQGESNLRGHHDLVVREDFWLLSAAFCKRPTPAAKPTWLFGEKSAHIKLLNNCRW